MEKWVKGEGWESNLRTSKQRRFRTRRMDDWTFWDGMEKHRGQETWDGDGIRLNLEVELREREMWEENFCGDK